MFDYTPFDLISLDEIVAKKEIRDPRKTPQWLFHYIDIASVSNKTFQIKNGKQLVGADAPSRARKVIRNNDVIIATTRPYLKSIAMVPAQLDGQICSTGFCVLRPTEKVLSDWLFYCAISDDLLRQITPKMRGANYPAVTDKDVLSAKIPLPSLAEQCRIVARIKECMERVEEIEDLRAEVVAEANFLAPSLYAAIEDGSKWVRQKVGELIVGSRNGRSIKQDSLNANGHVLSLAAVHDVTLNLSARKPIVLPDDIAAKYSISVGDVFVSRSNTRDLVGLASVANKALERIIYPDLLIKVEPRQDLIRSRFLAYALRTPESRKQIKDRAIGTSQSMVKISGQRLKDVEVPVPPIDVQDALIERFDEMHDLASDLIDDLRFLNSSELRQSILRKAFAGEL